MLREDIPALEERTPKGNPGGNALSSDAYTCNSSKAKKVLGMTFRSKEATFVELAREKVILAVECIRNLQHPAKDYIES